MDTNEPLVAGEAFKAMLSHVDPSRKIDELTKELKTTKSVSKKNDMIKKVKFLNGLEENGMSAKEAFLLHYVPVVPPTMRPTLIRGGNRLELADVNNLYRDHMIVNNSLKRTVDYFLPEELINERKDAYEGLKAISGLGEPISPNSRGRNIIGLLHQIGGKGSPKAGLFHNKILSKKQDFSGRATIYAEPNLGFNEAAVPTDMLWTMYKFHILRDLARQGYDYVNATKAWEERSPAANNSFLRTIKRVPMIINRAPTLMKSNITAVYPVPIQGSTMGLNPIHLPLFAGDYDGDALTLHVPMSPEAVEEARTKLLPKHQVHDYRRGLGQSIVAPGHEAILGSMHMTAPDMAQATIKFKTEAEVLQALKEGRIQENTPVEIEEHGK